MQKNSRPPRFQLDSIFGVEMVVCWPLVFTNFFFNHFLIFNIGLWPRKIRSKLRDSISFCANTLVPIKQYAARNWNRIASVRISMSNDDIHFTTCFDVDSRASSLGAKMDEFVYGTKLSRNVSRATVWRSQKRAIFLLRHHPTLVPLWGQSE